MNLNGIENFYRSGSDSSINAKYYSLHTQVKFESIFQKKNINKLNSINFGEIVLNLKTNTNEMEISRLINFEILPSETRLVSGPDHASTFIALQKSYLL